jgi:hypothetical protein
MALFLDADAIREIGATLGENFPQGALNELCDLLTLAKEGCEYAADDRADSAADCEDSDADVWREEADAYTRTAETLETLVSAISEGEKAGRA